ncbi:MAG: TonB-dependent receptor plug domain-containing protein, partial [Gemmatimonadetes bacterium]|nr:TonB-dependent receptor plug domain-containing protein [Gemmatimonadota bacterium]
RLGFSPETLSVAAGEEVVRFRLRAAPLSLEGLVAVGERSFSAASSEVIRDVDIQIRPRESSQELLRLAPGLVIAQHGGGGKPEQIFLRGFDADHGTDVAVSVDGTPVNLVSHGHGQGYADLHFLLPEVVEQVDVRKGPYSPEDGDFATAGAVAFRTRDRLPGGSVSARVGSFGNRRVLAMIPAGGGQGGAGGYVAAAFQHSDGPFEHPDDYRRANLFARGTVPLAGAELVLTASGYDAEWDASGQLPLRAVRAGTIGRFGTLDPSEGGSTGRYALGVGARSPSGSELRWDARAYAVRYRLRLFSNFTFFLADSVNGDGIEQVDDRWLAGAQAAYARTSRPFGRPGSSTLGVGARGDFADVELHHQRGRERLGSRVSARVRQRHLFTWAGQEIDLGERVRLQLGVRGDLFRFGVRDRLGGESGESWHGIVSPKASVAVAAGAGATLFGNLGSGFHSNHARDVVLAAPGDRVLPRALGAEAGGRYTWKRGSVAASLWAIDLESELVYVGDEGVTEPSGPT